MDDDYALALALQSEFFNENETIECMVNEKQGNEPRSLVDPYWELTDPNPDIRVLFLQFNDRFFWGRLAGIEVKWSPRMTLCAGLCCYEGRGGLCSVRLSTPLLKLRPRKDLIETLLHEMIHAYLFVTDNNKDHDGHGPEFHKHMYRINAEAGTKISVYHNFHDEVDAYRQHWWRCNGPCRSRKPYFGYVKRSMNRAPSKNDTWWAEHQRTCGGSYTKVKEPEDYGKKKSKKDNQGGVNKKKIENEKTKTKNMDIRSFGGKGKVLGGKPVSEKPKLPTLSPPSTQSKAKDDDVEIIDFLPGGKTPKKQIVPKNKPVSQGGGVKFVPPTNKEILEFDWTDSEDDEILANLSQSFENKPSTSGQSVGNTASTAVPDFSSDDSDLEDLIECTKSDPFNQIVSDDNSNSNSVDLFNNKDKSNSNRKNSSIGVLCTSEDTEKAKDEVKSDSQLADVNDDTNDVRVMLRKVWSQRFDANATKAGSSVKSPVNSSLSKSVKRPSNENDKEGKDSKRQKGIDDNVPISNISDPRIDSDKTSKGNSNSKFPTKVVNSKSPYKITSPIEKLFDKMKANKSSNSAQSSSSGVNSDNLTSLASTTKTPSSSTSSSNLGIWHNEQKDSCTNTGDGDSLGNCSPCPVCYKQVPTDSINDHLDLCLTMQAISAE